MRSRKLFGWVALLAVVLLGSACSHVAPRGGAPLELTIVHVNDTHSHMEPIGASLEVDGVKTYLEMGGAARMGARLKEVRAQGGNVLFVHAGDAVQGTLYFTKYNGEVEMKLFNELGLAAMVLGNHEFDRGPEDAFAFLSQAAFPILCANLEADADQKLSGLVKSYMIKEIGGTKVGIAGLVTPETKDISSPGDKIGFRDAAQAAAEAVAALEQAGVDKIILLTHLGYAADKALAAQVKGIDLIVGGHSHTLLGDKQALGGLGMVPQGEYPTLVQGPDGPVYIVQSWEWAKAVGVLKVSFDAQGKITQAQGQPALLVGGPFLRKDKEGKKVALEGEELAKLEKTLADNPAVEAIQPDPKVAALLEPYRAGVAALQSEVVAKVSQDLLHVREPGPHPSGKVLDHGSQVAPWVVQSMLAQGRSVGLRPDLALQNAGGVRTDLMGGDLTVGQVHSLMPFGNTLFLLELSGKEVLEAVSQAVGRGGGAFPYLAGARLVLDKSKPKEEQVAAVELAGPEGQWKPLDPGVTYRLITNSFVAQGGDGYATFKEAAGYRYDTGFIDALVFGKFVRGKELTPPQESGIVFKGE